MLYTFGGKAPQVDPTAFISASAELIGDVIVGPRCYIGPYAVIRADASRIVLEEEVAVEDGVIIHTGGEDPVVTISRRVTIGHGAIIHARVIGPEASIGMGVVLSLCSEIGAGSIVAEQVFNLPGLGRLLLTSISGRDYPTVQAIVVILALWVVLVNCLADIINQQLDPRLRLQ